VEEGNQVHGPFIVEEAAAESGGITGEDANANASGAPVTTTFIINPLASASQQIC